MTSLGVLQPVHLLLGALFLAAGLSAWFLHREAGRLRKQLAMLEQEQQELWQARYADTEEGLRDWLMMLELPQLAEEKRLREVAHQLRIVISERLMKMPRVC